MCRHTNTTRGPSDLRSVRTHLLSCVTETEKPTCPLKNTLQVNVTEQEVIKTSQTLTTSLRCFINGLSIQLFPLKTVKRPQLRDVSNFYFSLLCKALAACKCQVMTLRATKRNENDDNKKSRRGSGCLTCQKDIHTFDVDPGRSLFLSPAVSGVSVTWTQVNY